MTVPISYPGVYITEIPGGSRTIVGVATSITAFVGAASRGPADVPLRGGAIGDFAACGAIAGVYARTDGSRGVWKAPAGVDASLSGVAGLTSTLTDAENGQLNPKGINVLRTFRGTGSVVWGARTLRGSDALAADYKYVPVRRLALYLEETLYRSTQWVVFEPNDAPLWAQAAGQLISATNGTVDLSAGVAVDVRRVVGHGWVMLMGAAGDSLDHANAALDSDGPGDRPPAGPAGLRQRRYRAAQPHLRETHRMKS